MKTWDEFLQTSTPEQVNEFKNVVCEGCGHAREWHWALPPAGSLDRNWWNRIDVEKAGMGECKKCEDIIIKNRCMGFMNFFDYVSNERIKAASNPSQSSQLNPIAAISSNGDKE